jgi:hypothetical protein
VLGKWESLWGSTNRPPVSSLARVLYLWVPQYFLVLWE